MLDDALRAAVEQAIGGARITRVQSAQGGCIHRSVMIETDRRRYFLKLNDVAHVDSFAAEIDGLDALAAAGMRVPQPIAHGTTQDAAFLVLEHLQLTDGNAHSQRALGHALARMHATHGPRYGWARDNFIGLTPQLNTASESWIAFWRDARLAPQLALAAANGYGKRLQWLGDRLTETLPALLNGHTPAASLLHGDLWGGNAGALEDGTPVVFDPAVYYGDREADLAMADLFGGFTPDFHAAYRELAPLEPGYAARKVLYNLYHVLNHLNLFGGCYLAQAERMMERLLAECS